MERVNKDKPFSSFTIFTEAWRNRVELVGRKRGFFGLLEDGRNNSLCGWYWELSGKEMWARKGWITGMMILCIKEGTVLERRDIIDTKLVETLRSLLLSSHFSVNMERLDDVRVRMGEIWRYEPVSQERGRENGWWECNMNYPYQWRPTSNCNWKQEQPAHWVFLHSHSATGCRYEVELDLPGWRYAKVE